MIVGLLTVRRKEAPAVAGADRMTIEEVVRKVLLDEHADVIREAVKAIISAASAGTTFRPTRTYTTLRDVTPFVPSGRPRSTGTGHTGWPAAPKPRAAHSAFRRTRSGRAWRRRSPCRLGPSGGRPLRSPAGRAHIADGRPPSLRLR